MSYSNKQDELLLKLQRCIGKLSPKQSVSVQLASPKQSNRYLTSSLNTSVQLYNNISPKSNCQKQNDKKNQSQSKLRGQEYRLRQNWCKINDENKKEKQLNRLQSHKGNSDYSDYVIENTKKKQNIWQNYQYKNEVKKPYQVNNKVQYPSPTLIKQSYKTNLYPNKEPLPQNAYYFNRLNNSIKQQKTSSLIIREPFPTTKSYQNSIGKYEKNYKKYDQCYQLNDGKGNKYMLNNDVRKIQEKSKDKQFIDIEKQITPYFNLRLEKYENKNNEKSGKIKQFKYYNDINWQKQQQIEENSLKKLSIDKLRLRDASIGSITSTNKKNPLSGRLSISYQKLQLGNEINLKQIFDEMSNGNEDSYSKLQKISELNQRINMRIKNIISSFQRK